MELLFDSLMRDYTIGGMLLWSVEAAVLEDFHFFQFIQHFHARDRPSGDRASLRGRDGIRAVVDGQQRLTALYLGLRGSHTARVKYGRENNPRAWLPTTLHLDLARSKTPASDDEVDSPAFRFSFITQQQASHTSSMWFPVADVLSMERPSAVPRWFERPGADANDYAMDLVHDLRNVVWEKRPISYYLEADQDLHKVVTVFQRLNKAGTPLSMADVVFSTAVELWGKDARTEIDTLVALLNSFGRPDPFRFSRDFVLKACLVLADVKSIRFDVGNYGARNMAAIEAQWPEIREALRLTAELLGHLGYSGARLTSRNAAIPIAYYIRRRGNPRKIVSEARWDEDRRVLRRWLAEALIRGLFSGHSDTTLAAVREVIRRSPADYPSGEIMQRLKLRPLGDDDIERFVSATYGGQAFAVLSLVYPAFYYDRPFDLDHIHPRSFAKKRARIASLGLTEVEAEYYASHVDQLPNLQLLSRDENVEKRDRPFDEYLEGRRLDSDRQREYLRVNHMPPPSDLATRHFRRFFEWRRRALMEALRGELVR